MQSLLKGLPVICYNIRGNNDLIKNKFNGFFIKSYQDACNKINYLKKNNSSFNHMRQNAFRSIDKSFSKQQINWELYKIIKEMNKNSSL